ncbi:unnamed protein product, partial [Staurois parvus]
ATYLSLGPVVCSPQLVSPAVLYSRRPASSVWAPGCDSLRFHSGVPTAHLQIALRFLNGPVVFWDLSRVPKDYREGGRTPSASDRLCDQTGRRSGYLSNPGTRPPPPLPKAEEQSLMRNFPFWVELRF